MAANRWVDRFPRRGGGATRDFRTGRRRAARRIARRPGSTCLRSSERGRRMTSGRALVDVPLPTADPALDDEQLSLEALAERWSDRSRLRPMTAEQMRGADARA